MVNAASRVARIISHSLFASQATYSPKASNVSFWIEVAFSQSSPAIPQLCQDALEQISQLRQEYVFLRHPSRDLPSDRRCIAQRAS